MKNKTSIVNKLIPIFIVFIIANCIATLGRAWLLQYKINADVVIGANLLLFLVSLAVLVMHSKAITNHSYADILMLRQVLPFILLVPFYINHY